MKKSQKQLVNQRRNLVIKQQCNFGACKALLLFHHVDFVVVNSIYHFEIDPSATLLVQQRLEKPEKKG